MSSGSTSITPHTIGAARPAADGNEDEDEDEDADEQAG